MKKYIFPISISLCLGILMAYFIIHQYESYDGITVSKMASKLYYVQRGVYSDKANMENNMKDFTNYIYNVEDNMYYTYIGISTQKENADKIQEYYKKIGFETYVKEKITDNRDFVQVLSEYDSVLAKTNDGESIKVICNQVLSKYEEYVNGKRKN